VEPTPFLSVQHYPFRIKNFQYSKIFREYIHNKNAGLDENIKSQVLVRRGLKPEALSHCMVALSLSYRTLTVFSPLG